MQNVWVGRHAEFTFTIGIETR